jgi:hypothetical protein
MRRFVQRNGPVARVECSEIPSPPIHGCSTRTLLPSIRTTILRRSARSWLERADRDPIGRGRASPSIGVGAKLFCASQQIQGADVAFGSLTASPVTGCCGSYTPDNGHEGRRPARQRRAASGHQIIELRWQLLTGVGGISLKQRAKNSSKKSAVASS